MKIRMISIFIAVFQVVSLNCKANTEKTDFALQIYLPREITVNVNPLNLGQVAIIRGEKSLADKAGRITLGRFSLPGQEITIDRQAVLGRLTCNGFRASEIILTGAEKVLVKQQHQLIKGSRFVELASSYLKENPPYSSVCQWNPIRVPRDMVLPGNSKDIKLRPVLVTKERNRAVVHLVMLEDGKEKVAGEVIFRLKHNRRRIVTRVEIPKGTVITRENVTIEKIVSDKPEPANWVEPYGLVANRRMPANTVIRSSMVGTAKPQVLLKRNQNVVIRLGRSGLLITAIGKTIQDGRVGEYIKVRNIDSKRIILAKVNEDGTVEPVF